jgi:sodium/potassium-transporting ATPase subunit alpha
MSIISLPPPANVDPVIDATDALEKLGGKGAAGAYSEHLWDFSKLSEAYRCHIDSMAPNKSCGLTADQANINLDEYGPNVLTPPPKVPLWLLFLLQFTNLLIVLLMITATACIIIFLTDFSLLTNLYIGVFLWIVIFITCYETFSQESKSDELMEKFRAMVPEEASVIRDGQQKGCQATDIVPGDLIRFKTGDKVPADCRVIYNQGMKVDQSMITGESDPIEVRVDAADPNVLEAKNIIFNGSLVVDGGAIGLAIRTGDATLIGGMVELTGDVGKAASTLKADITYFVKILTAFALFQAAIVFIVGCSRGITPVNVFVNGFIVIMLGNVPQGLPSTVTACLFIIADRMGKQNVFVKKLDIIETLGSCTLICTDKTGTLTLNLMSVANTWFFDKTTTEEQFVADNKDEKDNNVDRSQILSLMEVAVLNSRVVLEQKDDKSPPVPSSDASELGLYRFFSSCIETRTGMSVESFREANPKVFEVPFNSANKWQMSIHALASTGKQVMFVKGGPDVLLKKCNRYLAPDGSFKKIDEEFDNMYNVAYEAFGGNGERVLGFSMYPMEKTVEDEEASNPKWKDQLKERLVGKDESSFFKDLIFVGLITLMDPPRKEVPQAVRDCASAGVRVVMVTGDHPLTAQAIAKQIGLITLPTRDDIAKERNISPKEVPEADIHAVVVKGSDIPDMTEDDWQILVHKKEIVFARTSPEQKLKIVKEFTAAGNITAMTGDGVNDSPALKQAAIGIGMGLNGSDVAREAADIILLDDNFASIVVGIKEGRLLFANLKKSIAYTLCHLTPEVVPVLLWVFGGCPQPMGALLCLCIDLLTELCPATSLAFEKPEANIMNVPPRNVNVDKLTNFTLLFYAYCVTGLGVTGGCYFTFFRIFSSYGISPSDLFSQNNQYFPSVDGSDYIAPSSKLVFSADDQNEILYQVYAAWFLMIVSGQAIHIWFVRTTTVSIFQHGIFSNMYQNIGFFISLALGCFVVYCPGLREILGAHTPNQEVIVQASVMVAGYLIFVTEGRKWFTRNYPQHPLNRLLAW